MTILYTYTGGINLSSNAEVHLLQHYCTLNSSVTGFYACTPDIISMAWSCIDEIDHLSRHIHTGTWAPFQDTASLYVSDYVCTCPALPLFTSLHRRRRPVTTHFCLVVVSVLYLACPPFLYLRTIFWKHLSRSSPLLCAFTAFVHSTVDTQSIH